MRKFSIGYRGKMLFIAVGLAIGIASLIYSNYLVGQLRDKERHEIHLWSFAVGESIKAARTGNRYQAEILARIIDFSKNIPVIVCDDQLRVLQYRSIDPAVLADPDRLANRLESMRSGGRDPIEILTAQGSIVRVFYDESPLLKTLRYFPWIELCVFSLFIGFAFIAFRSSKHSEQNRVWIGMAKETAHQLGTPTSSLLGWLEYLREQKGVEAFVVDEMNKDLQRLLKVVDRFSKIGATTLLAPRNIYELVAGAVDYFRTRIPKNVMLNFARCTSEPMQGMVNDALFEWVVENLLKNALDALQGRGVITVQLSVRDAKWICIDVRDTGKGIPKAYFKRIFQPGFTTKTRGWGLGLSLSKRIIEEYHGGKIFVFDSELDRGTTMRVMVRKF
ncbi:MAG: HAMP domain-containing histidine kinase [Rikenella sp.]|nr:HAMP domain-containing histidine kinase [Rikenella sp.]